MTETPTGPSPTLVVIAGPNGSGKTEFTRTALFHKWLEGCEYVNPDEIAQERFGGWNDRDAVLAALQHAETVRNRCLKERRSLAFETVFSTDDKIDFVKQALMAGFFVRFFFVGTDTPQINAARIAKRLEQGGHDVPIPKIISRYYKSMSKAAKILPLVDRGYVYDNSEENAAPALQFRTINGRIKKVYGTGHEWAEIARESVARQECENTAGEAPAP